MNIQVAAFTVSEKSSNTSRHVSLSGSTVAKLEGFFSSICESCALFFVSSLYDCISVLMHKLGSLPANSFLLIL